MDWMQYDWRELNSISPQELTGDTDAPCRMPRTIDQYMEMCSENVNQDVFLASFTDLWKHHLKRHLNFSIIPWNSLRKL